MLLFSRSLSKAPPDDGPAEPDHVAKKDLRAQETPLPIPLPPVEREGAHFLVAL